MALNTETLRSRLRIVFGSDPQDMVAKKLNMTQGTISKILSGNQQPTLETIYHIAEAYNVSVDWLLGLSEKRQVTKYNGETTYAIATETIGDLVKKGAKIDNEKKSPEAVIHIEDPLLRMLLRKSITLAETDRDMYENWAKEKLSLFADKPVLYKGDWNEQTVDFLASEAVNESDWVQTYECAIQKAKEYADMMGDYDSPFSG